MYINNIKDGVTAILVKDETDTNLLGFAHKSLYVKPKSGGGGYLPFTKLHHGTIIIM